MTEGEKESEPHGRGGRGCRSPRALIIPLIHSIKSLIDLLDNWRKQLKYPSARK